jgi:hypothetical protein
LNPAERAGLAACACPVDLINVRTVKVEVSEVTLAEKRQFAD